MAKKQRGSAQYLVLFVVWLFAALLAVGLFYANAIGFFNAAPVPAEPVLVPSTIPELTALPPTWTPEAAPTTPTEIPAEQALPNDQPRIEPTFTPDEPFPPTPTYVITPIAFTEGPVEFGQSTGGNPLVFYRFGTGAVHRLIVAGIHGGYEWNTTHLAEELITYIQANPDVIPRNVTLFIVPTLNPDGYARSRGFDGRVNDNGVDLNRNFPVNWAPDWDRSRCWNFAPTTSGTAPGSEVETQALINFVNTRTRVTALISYHSAALGIFPGGEPPDEESVLLAEALAAVSTYEYPPLDIGCFYTGTLADWAAAEGIAAVDLELHTHFHTDFEENLAILEAFLSWRR